MNKMTCNDCSTDVVPVRRINWLLLLLLNVSYPVLYFLSKKRCPVCNSKDLVPRVMDIERTGVQAMESIHIVATSKTIDTVVSRFEFLCKVHAMLVSWCDEPSYALRAQKAIDRYKSVHYNQTPDQNQIDLVVSPLSIDLAEFYAGSLEGVAQRSIDEHLAAIQTIKKEDAKQRRMAKIAEDLRQCLAELDKKCRGADSFVEVRGRLSAAVEATESGTMPMIK